MSFCTETDVKVKVSFDNPQNRKMLAFPLKWHFVENTTDYAACRKNAINFLVASTYKTNF